jgi:uncharacterized protein YdhG (YjbR/CyaY superfamily)
MKRQDLKEKEIMAEVDDYISGYPEDTQRILNQIRMIILQEAPDAIESMAYQMPAYKLRGKPLIYFAGFKNHIGLYATPSAHFEFKDELSGYKHGKGSVQFPLNQPIPFDLIRRMVKFRVMENEIKNLTK